MAHSNHHGRPQSLSRRRFVGTAATGLAGLGLGWPLRASWAMPGSPTDLRLVFFTDIHTRLEWETPDALALAADEIARVGADLILCGGDCITDGFDARPEEVAPRWKAYLANLHHRLPAGPVTALGNHDLVGAMPKDGGPPEANPRLEFLYHLGLERTWYSLDAGGCRIFVLDGIEVTPGGRYPYRGWIPPEQHNWLRARLRETDPAQPLIVMTHMPLMTGFFQATEGPAAPVPSNRGIMNARETLDLFRNHHLALVLQGHLHVDEMLRWGRTTFITGGAVCGKWWRGAWQGTPEGFGVLTLHAGRVDWEYRTYGWTARRPPGR